MSIRPLLSTLLTLVIGCDPPPPSPPTEPLTVTDPMEIGRTLTSWLYDGKTLSIWEAMTPDMQGVFGNERGLAGFRMDFISGTGEERAIVSERVVDAIGTHVYNRVAVFSKTEDTVLLQWSIDSTRKVVGLLITPTPKAAPSRHLAYETKTPLRLPFTGEWFVFWGGRDVIDNYHAEARDQRFAVDLVMVRDGRSHSGDGKRNGDYYCFGQPILAPAAGIVTATANDLPDQQPGDMNRRRPLGNHVIIDHGNNEYSFLAHLQRGSVSVQPGARVEQGQVIGRCGNSGNTSEPHVHYHLQNTPKFGRGEGLPAQFGNYVADGSPVERGELLRGQRITAPSP